MQQPDTGPMQRSLLVLLEDGAVSFCHYANPAPESGNAVFIPQEVLEQAMAFARQNALALTFVFGNHAIPFRISGAIERTEHLKILPFRQAGVSAGGIIVLNENDYPLAGNNALPISGTVIIRITKERLANLAEKTIPFLEKCARIEIVLLDIGSYKNSDFETYARQLDQMKDQVIAQYKAGHAVALNVLTDRLFLKAMRNCDAGSARFTAATDGTLYVCPGFYHHFPEIRAGSLAKGISMPNAQLYTLGHAPICMACSAFHCRRCLYLNYSLTQEINTPSRQQCIIAHVEELCTYYLREEIAPFIADPSALAPLSEPQSFDPLEIAINNKHIL